MYSQPESIKEQKCTTQACTSAWAAYEPYPCSDKPVLHQPVLQNTSIFVVGKCPNLGRDSISCSQKVGEKFSSSVKLCRKTLPAVSDNRSLLKISDKRWCEVGWVYYVETGDVRVRFRVRCQAVKVPMFSGFPLQNQLTRQPPQSSSKGNLFCPSTVRRGSEYSRGGSRLSELKDQHGKTQAEQYLDTTLLRLASNIKMASVLIKNRRLDAH